MRTPLLAAAGVAAVTIGTTVHDPNVEGSWLTCPFLLTTGFLCPGCGTLRALRALTEGDIVTAWLFNPALLVAIPLFFVVWVTTLRRAWFDIPRWWTPGPRLLGVIPVVITLYWVGRNIPGITFLGPLA
ncbi:MAG: DUF2752 domain-containing protein [Propioniciclava sp.]